MYSDELANAKMAHGLGGLVGGRLGGPSTIGPVLSPTQSAHEILQNLRRIQNAIRQVRIRVHGSFPEPGLDAKNKVEREPPLIELLSEARELANEQANIAEELASSI